MTSAMSSIRSVITVSTAAAILSGALATSPALAQSSSDQPQTRDAILDDARSALTTQSAPPTRSTTDRFLSWYDNQYVLTKLLSGWNGIHYAVGDFPAGAGIKFGVGYDKLLTTADSDPTLPNRLDLSVIGAYSTRGYARAGGRLNASNLGGAPVDVGVFGQYYEFPQEDFFGLGPDSQESARTNYLVDAIEAGVRAQWRPSLLAFSAGAGYLGPRLGRGTDNRYPSTEQVFDAAAAPGLGTETDFLTYDASAAFDWRDNPLLPHSGGRYAVSATKYDDRDLGEFDFHRIDVTLHQFLPLPDRYRRIALRAEGSFTNADSGQVVPFYLQPTLGGARSLRGFREFRYRDENSVVLGAEYQWEAWWMMDAALFVDAGTVARTREQLSTRDMEASYGFGLRFHSNRAFVGRLDLTFSREGFIPILRFDHVF
jgi:Omp85 superfamily domain